MTFIEDGRARRDQIVDYIAAHTREWGYPPTYREIGLAVGISRSRVSRHIKVLVDEGRIRAGGSARSLVVIGK